MQKIEQTTKIKKKALFGGVQLKLVLSEKVKTKNFCQKYFFCVHAQNDLQRQLYNLHNFRNTENGGNYAKNTFEVGNNQKSAKIIGGLG